MTVLKIILIYVQGYEKRNLIQILNDMCVIRLGNYDLVILDRYNLCQVFVEL